MDRARFLTVDTPDALRAATSGAMLEILAEPKRRALELLRGRREVSDVQVFGERLHVTLADVPVSEARAAGERLAGALRDAGMVVQTARPTGATLEDIFISRIRAAKTRSVAHHEVVP